MLNQLHSVCIHVCVRWEFSNFGASQSAPGQKLLWHIVASLLFRFWSANENNCLKGLTFNYAIGGDRDIMIVKMMMMMAVTWFPNCDIPSVGKWLFKVEMADALEVQSFLIQRLVGLLLAKSPVITGSQPRRVGGVDHCPCSWSTVHVWLDIRLEKPGVGGAGERNEVEDRAKGGERNDYELSGPSHAAGLAEHIMSEFKYTLYFCPLIWHHGFPPWCSRH